MEKIELEEQFILRLPQVEANYVRETLATKPKRLQKHLKINLNPDSHQGIVTVRNKQLVAKLRKLPTIIESMKSYNKSVFVKTADISQMLDCVDIKGPVNSPHGVTPPLKNVKNKRFRKYLVNKDEDAVNIQKELYYLLQADLAAVSTRFEYIYTNDNKPKIEVNNNIEQIEIFGNVLTDSETDSNVEEVP